MRDLSVHDAALKNQLDKSFRFLGIEGLFVLGIGIGWTLGLFSINTKPGTLPLLLIGIGGITLLASVILYYIKLRLIKPGFSSRNAIDVNDSLRALRIHGSQVPLIHRSNFRTEIICISKKESVLLPPKHRFIVEHWSGPQAILQTDEADLRLNPEQIMYFDSQQLELWEKNKMRLGIMPVDISVDEDLVLLIHIMPQEN